MYMKANLTDLSDLDLLTISIHRKVKDTFITYSAVSFSVNTNHSKSMQCHDDVMVNNESLHHQHQVSRLSLAF